MKYLSTVTLTTIAVTTFLVAPPLAAQTTLGVSVGATFSSLEGEDAPELDSRTGFMAGAHLAFPIAEIISVVPGVYYVQKGAADDAVDAAFELDYIEIPLLLSVAVLPPERPVGFNLFAGPQFSFRVGCSESEGGQSFDCQDEEDIKSTDFGLIAGGGVTFGMGGLNLFVNGGLDLGLTSLDDSPEDNDVHNSTYFVSGGVAFPLGG